MYAINYIFQNYTFKYMHSIEVSEGVGTCSCIFPYNGKTILHWSVIFGFTDKNNAPLNSLCHLCKYV